MSRDETGRLDLGEEEKFRSEATFFPGPLASLADLASGFSGNPVLICNDYDIFFPPQISHLFSRSQSSQYCPTFLL